ncbi:hypothetical protein C6361_06330 [Plantactinospora sp. BC1]|uniref:DUF6585 family protein n=1 Tax=Plantactinospora sp. BC1 TaxID=2108470 RepID=UPI000D15BC46|nr:DUF6585 family protein [Plantactinospora sp. BC1]AVT29168.1 hypothetical protein C6361_06330 [Plantactinospora sp. BC1]
MRNCPPEITEIVAETGLGEVVERYRQAVAMELSFAVTCGVLGVSGLVFGDEVGRAIGAGAGGLGVLFAVPAWRRSRCHLYLCTGGLLTTTGTTTVTRLLRWAEVAHVRVWTTRIYQLGPVEEFPRCVLELTDGTTLNLARPPYAGLGRLAGAVERAVTETTYPRRTAEIAETGTSVFGPITLSAAGVRDGRRFVAWSDVARVERGRVRLRIWNRAGRQVISRQVRTIPDLACLLRIASTTRGGTANPARALP